MPSLLQWAGMKTKSLNDQLPLAVVTGGAGFVGSHLVDALLKQNLAVIAVDNLLTGKETNLSEAQTHPHFNLVTADVSSDPTEYLPTSTPISYLFHLASPASPPQYQRYPVETYLANALGTHQLLSFLLEFHRDARMIFASTSEVYGEPLQHPQREDYWGNVNPNGPRSCYDESKRLGETMCGVFHRDFGLDVRIARIFNTYGARMDIADGRVIPNFVQQAKARQPYSLHGDGSQSRSYCHVSDLVRGLLALAQTDGVAGETVNLGNPTEFTVKQTAELIHKAVHGPDAQPEFITLPRPIDDPSRRQPDISKAKRLLQWEPQITFEEGLRLLVDSPG